MIVVWNDFKKASNNEIETWYDLFEDWDLIASSLKTQYGYSIRKEIDALTWGELSSDIAGLLPETPLGHIVQIRSEDDKEVLKTFTKEQLAIRSKWRKKRAEQVSEDEMKIALEEMKQAFIKMAGGG